MLGRPSPRKDQHTRKLSRFPGSRLGLLSAPSHPLGDPTAATERTVARADFNAAHSCGAAMESPRSTRPGGSEESPFSLEDPQWDHSASHIQLPRQPSSPMHPLAIDKRQSNFLGDFYSNARAKSSHFPAASGNSRKAQRASHREMPFVLIGEKRL